MKRYIATRLHDAPQLINQVRAGIVDESVRQFLDARLVDPTDPPGESATRLFPRRDSTEAYNRARLSQLLNHLCISTRHRAHQCVGAVSASYMQVGPMFQQHPDEFNISQLSRHH